MSRKFLTPVALPGNPTQALEATPKQYVDALVGPEVNVSTAGPSPRTSQLLWVDTDDPGPSTTTAWTALPLVNGWVNFGGAGPGSFNQAAYRKIGDEVWLRGLVMSGGSAIGAQIATLPVGFRPIGRYLMIAPTASTQLACRVDMNYTGDLLCDIGVNPAWLGLDGLHWSTI